MDLISLVLDSITDLKKQLHPKYLTQSPTATASRSEVWPGLLNGFLHLTPHIPDEVRSWPSVCEFQIEMPR